ncbi:uncharacterized protein EI90DRAFT_2218756 [Cantharellus anzutake]|uniref:uncharacterized protein n=1 Tax=Cantharellus anzutake TaxID=1750568 RepID=UPI0019030E49|nr:uncharacterized protein EI90DRAFT_2218756 [Cantharellus anzutake]KAF8324898.1 hypothetical protein EI90DRAFT_2218756 [Cantharellus anzutake]
MFSHQIKKFLLCVSIRPQLTHFRCSYASHPSVRLFLPHRSQFHFHADVRSFLTRIHLPANYPQALHPAFLNSVFLLACHVSLSTTRSSVIATYERIFLQRTRTQLEQSLAYADRLTHFLWGSAFLGSYYTRCGRFVEAYNTISAAVRFAVGCGIDAFSFPHNGATCQPFDMLQSDTNYEVAFMHLQSGSVPTSRDGKLLAPSNSPEELLRRNHLWGAIFLTDRTLVEASGMPSSVPRAVSGNTCYAFRTYPDSFVGIGHHTSTCFQYDTRGANDSNDA